MSDIMLHGVLTMPPELWGNDPISVKQRYDRYLQASKRIEELEARVSKAESSLGTLCEEMRTISSMTVGYCEGNHSHIVMAIATIKGKAAKYEASKSLDELLEKIDELADLKDEILSHPEVEERIDE